MTNTGPIKDLYEEHNGITIMLEILSEIAIRLRRDISVPQRDLARIVEFLTVFADRCHHGKEEAALIPEMRKSARADITLLNQIVGEHKTGRDLITGMRSALTGYKKGQPEVFHFAANAEGYIALLMDHIRKENVILFPQAFGILDDKQIARLSTTFDRIETDVVGRGKHEEFHGLLSELQRRYL